MTEFEEFATEVGVKITTDADGSYSGLSLALANITTDVVLSDDEKIFNTPWEQQKEIIKNRFYGYFPYVKPEA